MTHTAQIHYQRSYYTHTAPAFDIANVQPRDAHFFALAALEGWLDFLGCQSLLDIGAGTGRVVRYFRQRKPGMTVMGVEPVAAMREQAYRLGVPQSDIVEGTATKLPFDDGSFDIATETGVLHHIAEPQRAIAEMLRVSRKAIFISDSNNMGQGPLATRKLKHLLRACGLWNTAQWLLRGGRSYWTSDGDGLAYSFSIYDHYRLIRRHCHTVHFLNTIDAGISLYHSAPHVALLGIKA